MSNKLVDTATTRNLIKLDLLEAYFQEILPQIATFNLSANAEAFQRKFAMFKKRLTS